MTPIFPSSHYLIMPYKTILLLLCTLAITTACVVPTSKLQSRKATSDESKSRSGIVLFEQKIQKTDKIDRTTLQKKPTLLLRCSPDQIDCVQYIPLFETIVTKNKNIQAFLITPTYMDTTIPQVIMKNEKWNEVQQGWEKWKMRNDFLAMEVYFQGKSPVNKEAQALTQTPPASPSWTQLTNSPPPQEISGTTRQRSWSSCTLLPSRVLLEKKGNIRVKSCGWEKSIEDLQKEVETL